MPILDPRVWSRSARGRPPKDDDDGTTVPNAAKKCMPVEIMGVSVLLFVFVIMAARGA